MVAPAYLPRVGKPNGGAKLPRDREHVHPDQREQRDEHEQKHANADGGASQPHGRIHSWNGNPVEASP